MPAAEPAVPSFVMDRPRPHVPFSTRSSRSSLADERLAAFAEALPARARVSEPALPLCSRRCTSTSGARSSCCCPTTRTPATWPRPRAGCSGKNASRCCRAAASGSGSGLEPPPHLVGERARALDVLAAGGLVCASATALCRAAPAAGGEARSARARPQRFARARRAGRAVSRSPATNASTASRSVASSPCAAVSWTSSRRPGATRSESSSSATRSRPFEPSRPSRSGRSTRRRARCRLSGDRAPSRSRRAVASGRRRGRRGPGRPRPAAGAATRPRLAARRGPRRLGGRRA